MRFQAYAWMRIRWKLRVAQEMTSREEGSSNSEQAESDAGHPAIQEYWICHHTPETRSEYHVPYYSAVFLMLGRHPVVIYSIMTDFKTCYGDCKFLALIFAEALLTVTTASVTEGAEAR
nr:hypothetical protein CFP56_07683 [Quercus suber]